MIQNFKLIEKNNLTQNVFEMVFKWEKELSMISWQFITFLLDWLGWRAYSILRVEWDMIILIIKKREINEWWRWWSKFICELNIWESLKGVWPAGHFKLKQNTNNKLFIWTGTWLVPLYNMINYELITNNENKVLFIFWVREQEDIFYIKELEELKLKYNNFDYEIYISRVKDLHGFKLEYQCNNINSWYTTNYLTKNNIKDFQEAYICWAPTMIESSVEKLKKLDFNEDNIYFEKY
jgi:ferredoxin-NADP reductase